MLAQWPSELGWRPCWKVSVPRAMAALGAVGPGIPVWGWQAEGVFVTLPGEMQGTSLKWGFWFSRTGWRPRLSISSRRPRHTEGQSFGPVAGEPSRTAGSRLGLPELELQSWSLANCTNPPQGGFAFQIIMRGFRFSLGLVPLPCLPHSPQTMSQEVPGGLYLAE